MEIIEYLSKHSYLINDIFLWAWVVYLLKKTDAIIKENLEVSLKLLNIIEKINNKK